MFFFVLGSLWDRCGTLRVVVGRCGSLWDRCGIVVDRCDLLWIVVGRCGSFRVLVTTFSLNPATLILLQCLKLPDYSNQVLFPLEV